MVKNRYLKILIIALIIVGIILVFFYKKVFVKNNLENEKIENFTETLNQSENMEVLGVKKVLDFTSETCLPCKQMEVLIKELKEEYLNKVDIVTINVEANAEISYKYKILYTPTIVFLDENGNEISRHVGFIGKFKLKKIIDSGGKIDGNI